MLNKRRNQKRDGIASLWVLLWLPTLIFLVCFVVNTATLWLARVELENAMEAAAMAAVKEWGDAGGGSTTAARRVGVDFARINRVRFQPVVISENWGPAANNVNENLTCRLTADPPTGNLIFGSFLDNDPNSKVFDADAAPRRGSAGVLIDATGEGGLTANNNAWGIAFGKTDNTPADLLIDRIVVDLQAGGGLGTFERTATLSSSSAAAVIDGMNNSQPDIKGFANPTAQVRFSFPQDHLLQIDFRSDPAGNDAGFEAGDRIRFGAGVRGVSRGNGRNDGDGLGRDRVTAAVFFRRGGVPQPPLVVTLRDNRHRSNQCLTLAQTDPLTNSLIVHPTRIPDLPCPATSLPNNNGQSFARTTVEVPRHFAVRARATKSIRLPCSWLFGIGQNGVTAKATAVYDSRTGQVRLVRPDVFHCSTE